MITQIDWKALRKSMVTMRYELGMTQQELDNFLDLAIGMTAKYERCKNENGQSDPYRICNGTKFGELYNKLRQHYYISKQETSV